MGQTSSESVTALHSGRLALPSPLLVMGLVMACLIALLALPLTLPAGPFYWDLFVYFDAAKRIFDGQIPVVDFFTPVGPLGYWLFAGGLKIFPVAQPLLLVQWSLLVVTAPLMALVLSDVAERSRGMTYALLVPFLVFSILPINVEQYYPYPGVDGFGIYNRQVCHLLYVLAAALVFARGPGIIAVTLFVVMLCLFLTKITGLMAGLMLCVFAFAAGRIAFRTALAAAAAFLGSLALLEAASGFVSSYVTDILLLVALNGESLLPRFVQAASLHFGVVVAGGLLAVALLVLTWRSLAEAGVHLLRTPSAANLAAFFDRDALWLGVALFAGLFFETQNTGSQAFIFLWPVLLRILGQASGFSGRALILLLGLVAATSLPTFVEVVHRSARALIGQARYEALPHEHLGTLGAVSQRQEFLDRAAVMLDVYARHPQPFLDVAAAGQLPSFTLYSEPDFQIGWLKSVDKAVAAIRAYEAAHGMRFETIMSLNFVNPFPWLLDRAAPRHVAIGADPYRAVPTPDGETLRSVAATDLVLYPKCPVTGANDRLLAIYRQALAGHRRIEISPCWDGFLREGLGS